MATRGTGYDFLFKILVAGDGKVGKTYLLNNFLGNTNPPSADGCRVKTIQLEGKTIKLMLYETSASQESDSVATSSFRGVHAIMFVYDTSNVTSFSNLKQWLSDAEKYTKDDVKKLIVANVKAPRAVDQAQAKTFFANAKLPYAEADAATAGTVQAAFETIVRSLWSKAAAPAGKPAPAPAPKEEKKKGGLFGRKK